VLRVPGDFDLPALFDAVEEQRTDRGMSWTALTREIAWTSHGTFERMQATGAGSCHIVTPLIQWVGRTPESFTHDADGFEGELLPDPGRGRWRWYWHMPELAAAVETRRVERELSVAELADLLGTSPAEIEHLAATRYGTTISFAMRCARFVERSATSFQWEHDGRGLRWSGRRI